MKDACEPADGDNLDELSRELMLPRQLVNHKRYRSNEKADNNKSAVNNTTPTKNVKNNSIYLPKSKPTVTKSDGKANINNSKDSITTSTKKEKENKINNYVEMNRKERSITASGKQPKHQILIQQEDPEESPQNESYSYGNFAELAQAHQKIVSNLIQVEQKLVKTHESHVNEAIELIKKEMQLLRAADDPDANMQEYLLNLDYLIEKQLDGLLAMRKQVKKVISDYKQSEKIEKIYV